MEFKKGNLVFLSSLAMDYIYVVSCQPNESVVKARKLDSPMSQPSETLPIEKVILLAEEQEKLLPEDVTEAIHKQRNVIFQPPKKSPKKKKVSQEKMEKMLSKLSKESLEEILALLTTISPEDESDDNDEGGESL